MLVAASTVVSAAFAQEAPARLVERAHQDRDIVYFLRDPETHAFDLYPDYTEAREGADRYATAARKGSPGASPAARVLDTGAAPKAGALRGQATRTAAPATGRPGRPD